MIVVFSSKCRIKKKNSNSVATKAVTLHCICFVVPKNETKKRDMFGETQTGNEIPMLKQVSVRFQEIAKHSTSIIRTEWDYVARFSLSTFDTYTMAHWQIHVREWTVIATISRNNFDREQFCYFAYDSSVPADVITVCVPLRFDHS